MHIEIPKCYLNPPSRLDKYEKNSYSKIGHKGSIFELDEAIGYRLREVKDNLKAFEPIELEILDKIYKLDHRFQDLSEEIEDSKYIPSLIEGWGDNGAPILQITYFTAIDFLVKCSDFILSHHDVIITAPEIKPVRNGTIDLVWNTSSVYMAINVKTTNSSHLGTFFLFKKENKKIKEGEIDLQNIEPEMALWMKSLS